MLRSCMAPEDPRLCIHSPSSPSHGSLCVHRAARLPLRQMLGSRRRMMWNCSYASTKLYLCYHRRTPRRPVVVFPLSLSLPLSFNKRTASSLEQLRPSVRVRRDSGSVGRSDMVGVHTRARRRRRSQRNTCEKQDSRIEPQPAA